MMNRKEIDQEEQYFAHFNQEHSSPRNSQEIQAFKMYAQIRRQLRSAKVPEFNQKILLNRMVRKMEESRKEYDQSYLGLSRFRLFTTTAFSGVFVVCLFVCIQILSLIDWNLTSKISFHDQDNNEIAVPMIWKYQLLSGKKVNVPYGVQAILYLSDGSRIHCLNNPQIAVQFNDSRKIYLTNGKLKIYAAKQDGWPLSVQTPVGEVQVKGTVFSVELTQ